eukprot:TRINITY_DN33855_c0_g1_i1.p3 TRINITY_DN33855_c0_g1~~TRINITY_DN33855_c0_g1_i1.p3  ORF type:complete len:194 (+),score=69.05 TRINITY_DN33855_c0_g1_i1:81-584(+)
MPPHLSAHAVCDCGAAAAAVGAVAACGMQRYRPAVVLVAAAAALHWAAEAAAPPGAPRGAEAAELWWSAVGLLAGVGWRVGTTGCGPKRAVDLGLRGLCAAAANGVASGALLLALLDWGARGPHAWLAAYNMAAAGLLCAAGRRASARAWDAGAPGRLGYRRLSQTA